MADMELNVPDGWHRKQVAGFALKMRSGGTPKSDNPDYYNGEIPFVSIEDLTSANKYLDKTQKHITKAGLDNSSAWLVPENTLLYSIYATLGVPRITLIEAATNQAILGIIPDSRQIDLEFLFYLLLEKRQTILAHSSHTTQSNLNAKIVKELEFVFPDSLNEQRQIARVLSKVDEAISQTEQLIAKYRRLKTGLMQDLLTKGIDAHGNIRSEETHAFKDSPLGRIPVEWEVAGFGDFILGIEGGKSLECPNIRAGANQFGIIKVSAINKKGFKAEENKVLLNELLANEKYLINDGDFLISRANTLNLVGEACIVEGKYLKLLLSDKSLRVTLNQNKMLKYFAFQVLTQPYLRIQIETAATGSSASMKNISQVSIEKLQIKYPVDVSEQSGIIAILDKNQRFLETLTSGLAKLQAQKTGLMQDLLSGKVRVGQLIAEATVA